MKKIINTLFIITISIIIISVAYADTLKSKTSFDDIINTNNWKIEHGYKFDIYGSTSIDLTPISDYLSLLEENKIYITLPDLSINEDETRAWIYTKIAEEFYLTYAYFYGEKTMFSMEFPYSYHPREKATELLLMYRLGIDEEEAADLRETLEYNMIDNSSSISYGESEIIYYEILPYSVTIAIHTPITE